jgi:signal transduction histidine kinase
VTPASSFSRGDSTAEALAGRVQDVAPFGIFTTDGDLVIRSWNQWLESHSGLTAANVVGSPLLDLFPVLRERHLDERYRRALAGEISILSTALHGHLLPLPPVDEDAGVPHMLQSARIAPLDLGDGQTGTVTIIEDVTQRECQAQILLRQQEHDRILSQASEALLRSDRPLDVMAGLFPRLAAALKLDVFLQFQFHPETKELHLHTAAGIAPELRRAMAVVRYGDNLCAQVAEWRRPVIENRLEEKSEPIFRLARQLGLRSYAGFPLLINERLLGTISFGSYERPVIAPDELEFLAQISLSVAVALDRAQREASLETRVAERTASLNETIAQLESFSYTIAHDLRAPIRSLTNFSDILLVEYAAHLPAEAQDMLRRLRRAGQRLDDLTRDLLSYSRLDGKRLKLERIDLDEVVRDIIAVAPALQPPTLDIPAPLGAVTAQRTLLQQCLSNLFDNALKFAAPGTPARILVRAEKNGPWRRIWVEDNGIGIDPAVHRKIFDLFERIPGGLEVEGTGIGLAIVARATQQMGGTYGVESAPGSGSRFWLELPAA